MTHATPAILICDSVAWRLDRLGEALDRIRAGVPAGSLSLLRLGYRQPSDVAVIVLDPGATAGPRLGKLAAAVAGLQGLKTLDPTAGGLSAELGVGRALASCTVVVTVAGGAAAIAELRSQLAARKDPQSGARLGAVLPVRYASVESFLEAHDKELSAGSLFVARSGVLPPLHSSVPLELFPPGDADPIRALGTVVHHGLPGQPQGLGLHLALTDAARNRLSGIVKRLRIGPPPDSRRKDLRVEARLEVIFRTGEEVAREYTQNLSRGGAFVATATPPPLGSLVRLELVLPDGSRLELPAEVVRVFPPGPAATGGAAPGCGVSFRGLPPETRERLEGFIAAQALRPVARVLVVDNAALFRRLLVDAFVSRGCEVHEAASSAEVFQRLLEELLCFDLLVLGLELPEPEAVELLESIHQLGGTDGQMIAVLARSVENRLAQAKLVVAGADEVLPKSLTAPVLADRLLALVRSRPGR